MKKILTAFIVCLFSAIAVHAADLLEGGGVIKGKITTVDGQSAEDVTISVKGTGKGAITNAEGSFIIKNLPAAAYELEISLVGYQTVHEKLNLGNNETKIINIQLQLTQQQLKEVVVLSKKQFFKTSSDFVAKMPLKNLENAQVYNVVSRELLKEQLIFSVDDATKNAPGLQKMWDATARSGDGGAYYNSRGFILQSQLRNGVAGNISSRVDAVNLESLEVIKGPSATLFGSTLGSYGGLINRVTKKPYAKLGGEMAYSTGSYGFNRVSADVNIPLNPSKDLLFRMNTAYNSENSFQDNGWEKGYAVAPSLSYQLNDKLSFQFDAEFYGGANTSKQMIFFYFPADQLNAHNPRELGIDYKRSYSANDIFQTYSNYSLFGQMKYKMSRQWTSETNISTSSSYSDGPYAYFYVVPNAVATGVPTATGADYLRRADQSTAANTDVLTDIQQNFIGDFNIGNMRNRFVGGLDFFSHNSNQLFYGADFDLIKKNGVIPEYGNFNKHNLDALLQDPARVWNYPYFFANKTFSAYASDVLNITGKLIASAALRVDHFDNLGNFDKNSGEYSGGYKQTAFSPRFGLVYQPVKDRISLFVNYQNGFTNKTGADFDGNIFKPEHANQVEGGVKLNAFQGKLSGTISYYDIQVKDLVRADPAHATFSIQDGTQRSKGFEAEIIANPVDGLNIIGGFSYNDSKMTKSDADVEGRRPATAMSPTTANFWMSYRLPFGSWQGLGFGFGGNYASDNKILNSVYYGEFVLPAYTVLNATVFYEQAKFRVGLKADNLTNQEYWIGYGTMNAQKLRSFTASIAFKF